MTIERKTQSKDTGINIEIHLHIDIHIGYPSKSYIIIIVSKGIFWIRSFDDDVFLLLETGGWRGGPMHKTASAFCLFF
jgi:hypothetical protein